MNFHPVTRDMTHDQIIIASGLSLRAMDQWATSLDEALIGREVAIIKPKGAPHYDGLVAKIEDTVVANGATGRRLFICLAGNRQLYELGIDCALLSLDDVPQHAAADVPLGVCECGCGKPRRKYLRTATDACDLKQGA